jgi:group I intron endonuclease
MEAIAGIYKINSKAHPDKIYIGSAVNYEARKRGHINSLKRNSHKNRKIQAHFNKYGVNDLVFVLLENVPSKDELTIREQYYIDMMHPSFNICKVAGSSLGVKRTEEYKAKMSLSKKGKHHRTECSIEKSMRMMGHKGTTWFRHTEEAKVAITANHRNKKITLQYDLNGNFIAGWGFVKDAAKALNMCSSGISMCCNGKISNAYGFIWKYAPDSGFRYSKKDVLNNFSPRKKTVIQYDKNKSFIKEWKSMSEAGNALSIHVSVIWGCCYGKGKTAGGFIWKLKNQII